MSVYEAQCSKYRLCCGHVTQTVRHIIHAELIIVVGNIVAALVTGHLLAVLPFILWMVGCVLALVALAKGHQHLLIPHLVLQVHTHVFT